MVHLELQFQIHSMNQVNIKNLDDYLSNFYEDNIEKKVASARNIMILMLDLKNLQTLIEHESLLPNLSRVLAQEHTKSIQMCVYLQCFFYFLSNYTDFHQHLIQHKVGKTCLDVLEYQIGRFDLRYSQYIELWKASGGQSNQKTDVELRKLNVLISKQDKLFFVTLSILLNLSEDYTIEKKMKKNGIIKLLIRMLQRNDFNLLVVSLLFLRKLSIFGENKNQMLQLNLIDKLTRFFSCDNNILLQLALTLYKNMCFDQEVRLRIQKAGLIPKFIQQLHGTSRFCAIVILYLLSIDDTTRYTLAYTQLMGEVIKLIMGFPQRIVGSELVALAINLAANKRNVEHVTEEEFHGVLDRALRAQDTCLLKFCKLILQNTESKQVIDTGKGFVGAFQKLAMTKAKNEQLLVQVIGCMANLRLEEGWKQFLTPNFIDFIDKQLTDGICEDDIILATVMLISNLCQGKTCATILSRKLFKPVLVLFIEKVEDPEFTIQLLYCIYKFIAHKLCVEDILDESQVLMRLLLLIQSPYQPVRKANDDVLNILREYNDIELLESIKQRKFYEYNKQWLQATEEYGGQMEQYGMLDDQYYQESLDPRMWENEDDYD